MLRLREIEEGEPLPSGLPIHALLRVKVRETEEGELLHNDLPTANDSYKETVTFTSETSVFYQF